MTRQEGVQLGLAECYRTEAPPLVGPAPPDDLEDLLLAAQAILGRTRRRGDLRLLKQTGSDPGRSSGQAARADQGPHEQSASQTHRPHPTTPRFKVA